MRSETDLRAACEELAAEAPELEPIVDRLTHPVRNPRRFQRTRPARRPRAAIPLIATVAVVAAVAVGIGLVASRSSTPKRAATSPAQHPTSSHLCAGARTPAFDVVELDPVAGFTGKAASVACDGQRTLQLYTGPGFPAGWITVYRPGSFDTAQLSGARPVHGHGISGYVFTPRPPSECTAPGCSRLYGHKTLAWQYRPGAWATVRPILQSPPSVAAYGRDPFDTALAIAAATHPDSTTPIRSVFRLGYLPAGVSVDNVQSTPAIPQCQGCPGTALQLVIAGKYADCTLRACPMYIAVQRFSEPSSVSPGPPRYGQPPKLSTSGSIRSLTVAPAPHWRLGITFPKDSGITDAEALRIAKNLTLAPGRDPIDQSNWFVLNDALPR